MRGIKNRMNGDSKTIEGDTIRLIKMYVGNISEPQTGLLGDNDIGQIFQPVILLKY